MKSRGRGRGRGRSRKGRDRSSSSSRSENRLSYQRLKGCGSVIRGGFEEGRKRNRKKASTRRKSCKSFPTRRNLSNRAFQTYRVNSKAAYIC